MPEEKMEGVSWLENFLERVVFLIAQQVSAHDSGHQDKMMHQGFGAMLVVFLRKMSVISALEIFMKSCRF